MDLCKRIIVFRHFGDLGHIAEVERQLRACEVLDESQRHVGASNK
jgi:hypothetical protein